MGRRPLRRTLDVYMNGRMVGAYTRLPDGAVGFRYDRGWLDGRGPFAISRSLPLTPDLQRGDRVAAVFENLLPDDDRLRRALAERTEARGADPHSLLAAIGRDCVGAMQFLPEGEEPENPFAIASEQQSEAQIASTLRNLGREPLGIVAEDAFRISVAGAQEKTAYLRRDGAWHRPMGLTPTSHIFKRPLGKLPNGIDMTDSVENEHLCLRLAGLMGLEVAGTEIETFEDETALVVGRFDRRPRPAGGILRLPQEDFLQAMGMSSAFKYQQHGGPSMVACLDLLGGSATREEDLKAFLKAQIFFWLISAIDGHAKNFSLFLGPGGFRMTPLYDVLSAAPADAQEAFRRRELQLAMSVGDSRHYRLDQILPRHFLQSAATARVPQVLARAAMIEMAERGDDAFTSFEAGLADDVLDRVANPILSHGRRRLKILQAAL